MIGRTAACCRWSWDASVILLTASFPSVLAQSDASPPIAFKGFSPSTSSISLDHYRKILPPPHLAFPFTPLPIPQKLPISTARESHERAVSTLLDDNTSGTRPKSPS
ncbi:hypothetical protein F4804DRAFT_338974 [Jackrogersella minutella]|nr:hypothetical protein F4804DRAFT_338974 [Jackrogersella minutella]